MEKPPPLRGSVEREPPQGEKNPPSLFKEGKKDKRLQTPREKNERKKTSSTCSKKRPPSQRRERKELNSIDAKRGDPRHLLQ